MEIDEKDADRLFHIMLKLVTFFSKFKFGDREFRQNIEFLKLSQGRKAQLLQKIESNWQELHKKLSFIESDGMAYFKKLDWRYDIQVASRSYELELKPRVFLKFELENESKRGSP